MSEIQCWINSSWLRGEELPREGDFMMPATVVGIHSKQGAVYYFYWTVTGNPGLQTPAPFHAFKTASGWPVWSLTRMVWWYNWDIARERRERKHNEHAG